jgi:hypothetical protein
MGVISYPVTLVLVLRSSSSSRGLSLERLDTWIFCLATNSRRNAASNKTHEKPCSAQCSPVHYPNHAHYASIPIVYHCNPGKKQDN